MVMGSYYAGLMNNSLDIYLEHSGIKGQKWGVRRFQNEDGTWTDAGKKRYSGGGASSDESTGDGDKDQAIGKIKAMYSKLKDKETSKELDYIIGKIKSGAYSAKEAIDAAENAVSLDEERVKYKAAQEEKKRKKAEAEKKKKEKEQTKQVKLQSFTSSNSTSSASTKPSKSVSKNQAMDIIRKANERRAEEERAFNEKRSKALDEFYKKHHIRKY